MPDDNNDGQNQSVTPPAGNTADLPQWARDAISRANSEAAGYRTERNDFRDKHTTALTQNSALSGEKSAAEARAVAAEKELLKYQIAVESNVPGAQAAAFSALLQGDDQAALKAHADQLLGMFGSNFGSKATDPSQGRGDGEASLSEGAAWFTNALRGVN